MLEVDAERCNRAEHVHADDECRFVLHPPHLEDIEVATHHIDIEAYNGSGTYNCAGYYGATCNSTINPVPKWRHTFTDTWATPVAGHRSDGALAAHRLAEDRPRKSQPAAVFTTAIVPQIETIGSRDYLDLMLMYRWKGLTTRLGVNNALDEDPPIISAPLSVGLPPPFFNGNTYPQVYDTLGRYMYLNITYDF